MAVISVPPIHHNFTTEPQQYIYSKVQNIGYGTVVNCFYCPVALLATSWWTKMAETNHDPQFLLTGHLRLYF
jgi:hypothetical protein